MNRQNKADDKTYREICDEAIADINTQYPIWTDRNAHDPGITLIELISWLTEAQRYFVEKSAVPELLYPLLGVKPLRTGAAQVTATFRSDVADNTPAIPAGTPVYAEQIRFETLQKTKVGNLEIAAFINARGDFIDASRVKVFYPFEADQKPGDYFDILLKNPLASDSSIELTASIFGSADSHHTPSPETGALIKWEYLTKDGLADLQVDDQTYGLTSNGNIIIDITKDMDTGKHGYYVLRGTLMRHKYAVNPGLLSLKASVVNLRQCTSVCQAEIIGIDIGREFRISSYLAMNGMNILFQRDAGHWIRVTDFKTQVDIENGELVVSLPDKANLLTEYLLVSCVNDYLDRFSANAIQGVPNQRVRLDTSGQMIVYESFELLVAEDESLKDAVLWEKTDYLHRSSPHDCHYTLDEVDGELVFGDGFHGRIPAGVLIPVSMAFTLGEAGNIKSSELSGFTYNNHQIQVTQKNHASGGRDRESNTEALQRTLRFRSKALTAAQYEHLILQASGIPVDQVKVYAEKGDPDAAFSITIAIKFKGNAAQFPDFYTAALRKFIEPYRLVGTEIKLLPPVYVHIRLYAEVCPRDGIQVSDHSISLKLQSFFEQRYSGFGAHIRYGDIFSFLETLPEVESAQSLHISADYAGAPVKPAGDIQLGNNCIACLDSADVFVH